MKIVSVVKDSFQEFQDEHALVLFCADCNLACPECYNLETVTSGESIGTPRDVIEKNITEMHTAVVFLGGEPITPANFLTLTSTLSWIKFNTRLKTKIFTNGMHPGLVDQICESGLLDAISIDFKCLTDCCIVTGTDIEDPKYRSTVEMSIRAAVAFKIPVEIRTTAFDSVRNHIGELKGYVRAAFPGIPHIIQEKFNGGQV